MQIQACYAVSLGAYVSLAEGGWCGQCSTKIIFVGFILHCFLSKLYNRTCLFVTSDCVGFFLFCSSAFPIVCWRRGWIQKHWSLWVWSNRHSSLTRRLWKLKPNFCESQYMPYSQHNESVWSVKSASSLNVSHCTVSCSIISQYVNVPVNELVFYWM